MPPRFIRPDSYMLSKESIHTGENVTITGKWVSLTDKTLQARMLFYSEPGQHGRWTILSMNPSGDFVIPGNSIIQYNITAKALLPGKYHLESGMDLIGIGASLMNNGCPASDNIQVDGNPLCATNLVAVTKSEDGSSACVKPDTAQKLIERGWAKFTTGEISQTSRTNMQNNDPFGITALVIYHPFLGCLSSGCPHNNFYLKINSNTTAYLTGYNICNKDSCAKNSTLSVLLPINTISNPDYARIELPESLKWKDGDVVAMQLQVSPTANNETRLLVDLGNSTIVP
ncbi:MAG: hypothetical protein KGI05_06710 [Thaumarchaeota archaeon]|nr:hypothetical protein [Nitrososphaerota archaeon]